MNETAELLRAWAERRSEDAFAQLVARHVDLVYSVAIRKTAGDTGLAADITQTVFADLARKAGALRAEGSLAGWLHRHTCFVAATAVRGELRRRAREQTAAAMHAIESHSGPDWSHLAPLLDDAVDALDDADRRAILLRFYEHRDLRAVGEVLGVSDDTAQKRVSRALEKLRAWLFRRGVTSTSAALAVLLGAQSVSAAPAGLAAAVTIAATASTAGTTTLTLLEIMTHLKTKLAVVAAVAAVVAPVAWQETAIARVRSENRALAAPREPVRAQTLLQEDAAPSNADAPAARDREELIRLRVEEAALRGQLQQARAAQPAASRAQAGRALARPPGFIALAEARDVGAGSGEALLQTLLCAMRTGNTNRILEICDWTGEGAQEQIGQMVSEIGRAPADAQTSQLKDAGFRVIRQVPLEGGDAALVVETFNPDGTREKRQALRIRQAGPEWRMVIGKDGPDDVKLSDNLMAD